MNALNKIGDNDVQERGDSKLRPKVANFACALDFSGMTVFSIRSGVDPRRILDTANDPYELSAKVAKHPDVDYLKDPEVRRLTGSEMLRGLNVNEIQAVVGVKINKVNEG
ncbi:hypothetical protein KJ632_01040 [Patescibacteria group bacterium]|nr:hypothetical protein [Patescibacteria group bacterium]